MDLRRVLSTLAQQIEVTRKASETEEAQAGLLRALFHSFRVTYLALSTGLDPRKDASHLFTLLVTDSGLPLLMQGGQPVPVNAPFLRELFATAGVEPLPGQVFLLEAEIAKAAVEEALGGVALEQALADPDALAALETERNLLWDRKSDLIAASLVADEYLERTTADPEQEAA